MQTLTIGRATYSLSPSRNVGELAAKLAKCNGKYKPTRIAAPKRRFPKFSPGMSTADYVAQFERLNEGRDTYTRHKPGFWGSLNTRPCALYTGADTHEIIDDEAADCQTAPEAIEAAPLAHAADAPACADTHEIIDDEAADCQTAPEAIEAAPLAHAADAPACADTHDTIAEAPTECQPEPEIVAAARRAAQQAMPAQAPEEPPAPRPAPTIDATPYRYAAGMLRVDLPRVDGYRARALHLAEAVAVGLRWVGRAQGYVGSPTQVDKLRRLYTAGWDARGIVWSDQKFPAPPEHLRALPEPWMRRRPGLWIAPRVGA